ncbi:hypothetical protein [Embleya sp. NPDC020630]|uniref:hypothetical protein n=1 Tax=Embleya sp. NPDC020630 TaxID=3363979 RepID=UPI0037B89D10
MSEESRRPMISREQVVACLRVPGVDVPEPADDPDAMSRPMALGLLLFLIEAAAAGDVDRLDQEVLRSGYQAGARSAAADHPRADDAWVTTFVSCIWWPRGPRSRRGARRSANWATSPEHARRRPGRQRGAPARSEASR